MRNALVLASLLIASPVAAAPLQYTFTGTVNPNSAFLDLGAGLIDLAGAHFTITGVTEDPIETWKYAPGIWRATSTYDFGALGSFTTNPGEDFYVQYGTGGVDEIGLMNWYPGIIDRQGFQIEIAHVAGDPTQLTALGTVTPLLSHQWPTSLPGTSSPSHDYHMANTLGQTLAWGKVPAFCPFGCITIDSATVTSVPEPGTMLLLGLGVTMAYLRRRHQ